MTNTKGSTHVLRYKTKTTVANHNDLVSICNTCCAAMLCLHELLIGRSEACRLISVSLNVVFFHPQEREMINMETVQMNQGYNHPRM